MRRDACSIASPSVPARRPSPILLQRVSARFTRSARESGAVPSTLEVSQCNCKPHLETRQQNDCEPQPSSYRQTAHDLLHLTWIFLQNHPQSCHSSLGAFEPMSEPQSSRKKLFIETVGCQMNILDSELVVAKLRHEGYVLTDDIDQADTILYNTCSVRQRTLKIRFISINSGRIKSIKQTRPEVTIGVLGCMAQKDQKQILKRAPHVDIVVGPGQLGQVSELLAEAKSSGKPQMAVSLARTAGSNDFVTSSFAEFDPMREPAMRPNSHQAFVRIMMGCDKFCTYCVVPAVRGPGEQSRPPEVIVAETRQLVDQGVKEITLIGQTVNSYKFKTPDGRYSRLSDLLLEQLHEIDGVCCGSSLSRTFPTI